MIAGRPRGIIDIGSNSVRLVVYAGPKRAPAILFNEKVMAGLGQGLGAGGALDPGARDKAMRALARFRALADSMEVGSLRVVATAAIRDARDGADFVDDARGYGLDIELLSGAAEGEAAGLGVLSGIPHADGIVGDMGGGSLELVRVADGRVGQRVSLPLGGLRVAEIRAPGAKRNALDRHVSRLIADSGFVTEPGLPFYMVGGSWRALARLHMELTGWPLTVLHQYAMPGDAATRLVRALGRIDRKRLKAIGMSGARIASLGDAAALLQVLVRQLSLSELVVSAAGLREGLLYAELDAATRALDPLTVQTRAAGAQLGRFAEHGAEIDDWIAPLFPDERPERARLRHAACLLGDVAWSASPEFRCERGLEVALHGAWTAVDAGGRAMIGQALYTSFGGNGVPDAVAALIAPDAAQHAMRWGLAMRLGQRLSGGVAAPLEASGLALDPNNVTLRVDDPALYGEAVERRHRALASAFARAPALA